MLPRPARGDTYIVDGVVHRIKNFEQVAVLIDLAHGLAGEIPGRLQRLHEATIHLNVQGAQTTSATAHNVLLPLPTGARTE